MARHEAAWYAHRSVRIPVEHGIAHIKNRRVLERHHGQRETLPDTIRAVAGLRPDRQTAQPFTTRALPAGRA
ncbi:hypothetical protein [Streptomyces sp. NRRL F-2664]|uniref:hypothetical protein n=1 Tax=Streptomyces sp. NRRL F-2664 TaxID=1463842 RepID=UPI000B01BA53|nr:hypothetical protein [Streptomyces sp. NRRL F-2664]